MRVLLACAAVTALFGAPAFAQAASSPGQFERGYGMDSDSWNSPINPATRDANGNRLIVDGRIMANTSLYGGLTDAGYGDSLSAQAIGNQLNVVTQGSWNTVIIDSTQINNGDVIASANGANQ